MTEEKRATAVLATLRRGDELRRDIQILEQQLRKAGPSIERLGRALSENPSDVRQSVREHAFELPNNVSINLRFDEVRRSVVELQEARKELSSVNAVLEPGIIPGR